MEAYFLNPDAGTWGGGDGTRGKTLKGDRNCEDEYFTGNDELSKRYSNLQCCGPQCSWRKTQGFHRWRKNLSPFSSQKLPPMLHDKLYLNSGMLQKPFMIWHRGAAVWKENQVRRHCIHIQALFIPERALDTIPVAFIASLYQIIISTNTMCLCDKRRYVLKIWAVLNQNQTFRNWHWIILSSTGG